MNIVLVILIVLIVVWFFMSRRPTTGIRNITAAELENYLSDKNRVFVDVREPHEYKSGHVQGMKNIPLGQLAGRTGELPKDREIVLMCRSGGRSMMAAKTLKKHGYSQIVNVRGGISAWSGKVVK
ncbi:MAG: rhodanese-like domain-containing protein [Firmicutes bacterium]|nr:rhodanese-like domain-containing protein [Bacillota bacterium]